MKYPIRRAAIITSVMALFIVIAPPTLSGAANKPPLFEKVTLAPVAVEPLSFDQTPPRSDEAEIVRKLAGEATKQAERILVRAHVAQEVVRVDSTTELPPQSDNTALTAVPRVSCILRLPVSLPPTMRGWTADHRNGRFATVSITITGPQTGAVLARSEGACDWKDGWWIRGARSRRNAPLDVVLAHVTRKTTERAVWQAYDSAKPMKKE